MILACPGIIAMMVLVRVVNTRVLLLSYDWNIKLRIPTLWQLTISLITLKFSLYKYDFSSH